MRIIKIIIAVLFFIISMIFIITGIMAFTTPNMGVGWGIGFIITGSLFLWLGIILCKKPKNTILPLHQGPADVQKEKPVSKEKLEKAAIENIDLSNIDINKDIIEINYRGHEGETSRQIRPIGKESTTYGDFYIKCYCYLRNEERTFRLSRIENLLINKNEYDNKVLIKIVPDIVWNYNINAYITYENVEGEINSFNTDIHNIRIAENGDYYIDRLSLYKDLFTLNTKHIKKVKIDGITIDKPVKYFEELLLGSMNIGKYINQVKLLIYISRLDNRFTKEEKDLIYEYVSKYDTSDDAKNLIQLRCDENEYKEILEKIKNRDINDDIYFIETLDKIFNSKKTKNPKEEYTINEIKNIVMQTGELNI